MAILKYCCDKRKLKMYPTKSKYRVSKRTELCKVKYRISNDLLKEHNFLFASKEYNDVTNQYVLWR